MPRGKRGAAHPASGSVSNVDDADHSNLVRSGDDLFAVGVKGGLVKMDVAVDEGETRHKTRRADGG